MALYAYVNINICGGLTNLVIGVIDDIILQKLCRYLQFEEKAGQVSPLLQFMDPLQQPVEDRVHHRFAACHQTLSEGAPASVEKRHVMKFIQRPPMQSVGGCSHLHISMVSRGLVFQHPQQRTHPLHCLLRHFFTYIHGLLNRKSSINTLTTSSSFGDTTFKQTSHMRSS